MCVYLFAPRKKLQVDYASETITLFKDGNSTHCLDLLVTNKSPGSIDEIYAVFPHSIPAKKINTTEEYELDGTFAEETFSFAQSHHKNNVLYKIGGRSITAGRSRGGVQPLTVSLPNPLNPAQNIEYIGDFRGNAVITPWPLDELRWEVLTMHGFSIFKIGYPEAPLEQDKPRWIRISARGKTPWINRMPRIERLVRIIASRLFYQFEINGPTDVRLRLIEVLQSAQVEQVNSQDSAESAAIGAALISLENALERELDMSCSNGTEVDFPNWHLHIFPGTVGRLTRVTSIGDVFPAGPSPNLVMLSSGRNYVYEWKGGAFNCPQRGGQPVMQRDGGFSISLEAKPWSGIVILVPYISLTLAIIGLALRFLGK